MVQSADPHHSLRAAGAVLLVSCYELGHQPLGLAWPMAFLERAGFAPRALDLAVEPLDEAAVRRARLAVIAAPMHTALRLAVPAARRIRTLNAHCRVVFCGLYALLSAEFLLAGLADAVLGGEFEESLVALAQRLERGDDLPRHVAGLDRLAFPAPSRGSLPPLARYVRLAHGGRRVPAGYVEASRGCLHTCLHCPIPPAYGGRFFAVPRDIVLEDIRSLIAAGAGHITFGDPDFLNGPGHALRLVRALHAEFPDVTYDFTTKIEHILRHGDRFDECAATGCVFVVTAVESLSDVVLANLEKGHTAADVPVALDILRQAGITPRPTFVPFTPWAALDDYLALLEFIEARDLVDHVDPVQLTIRLLVPPGSLLLERPALRPYLGALDAPGLSYRWTHPDPRMDALQRDASALVARAAGASEDPAVTFQRIRALAGAYAGGGGGGSAPAMPFRAPPPERPIPPRLTEPWFC
jgi:radical SAM superfamily enzyme YgiQ (UPF0313 family)